MRKVPACRLQTRSLCQISPDSTTDAGNVTQTSQGTAGGTRLGAMSLSGKQVLEGPAGPEREQGKPRLDV
ncbi:hypothetical protein GN956_G10369 [Arapaima gigas]